MVGVGVGIGVGLPTNHQEQGEAWTDIPSQPCEENSPANTLTLDFQPPKGESINFCSLSHLICGALLQQSQA